MKMYQHEVVKFLAQYLSKEKKIVYLNLQVVNLVLKNILTKLNNDIVGAVSSH